ncbi:Clp protease ClpP [Pseudooceanicola sp. CBS1P-1]|uniref:ATP-dependent Clp protease proteolytic subunit n=1 Tax=Pseudooceanicola albus TaxID=2692189 RepID=A0A6L7FYG3_9RHOB|nr:MULTISPECIES: head maturation protease, ClpP-related [Pseudooceanicola]MBT9383321.1 Clp protease ClpP [Pseudooceanicola endophyticus]MXN16356.1 Clp protease ClpP [Pseudooceanicola albus]
MGILVDGELLLYGVVGDDFWGDGFTSSEVITALAEVGRDTDITVRINSGGGYTDDGIAIYNALQAHRGDVAVVVDAIAASSASIIAMAGDTITMRTGALMMIHDPAMMTWGNAGDHEKSTEQLHKLADLMADIYAEQTGEDAAAIREDMKAELWMTGAEAVERGFATDTESGKAKAVAAFDYRAYAQAPKHLKTTARKEKWSFKALADPAAPAAKPKTHAQETPTMDGKNAPQGTPPGGPTSADVKARIKAITGHKAAAGRATLAAHLAFDTDMPLEEAVAVMEAAAGDAGTPEDTPPEGTPDPDGQGGSTTAELYQQRRTQSLAQPGGKPAPKPQATIDMRGIYAARNKGA